jgi:hypothetical protein
MSDPGRSYDDIPGTMVFDAPHVPASNTAVGHILLQNKVPVAR